MISARATQSAVPKAYEGEQRTHAGDTPSDWCSSGSACGACDREHDGRRWPL